MIFLRLPFTIFMLLRGGVLGHLARGGGGDGGMLPRWLAAILRCGDFLIARRHSGRPGLALARALERLGPGFIKLGQALSTRADILGAETAADLALLQDRLAPFPPARARKMIAAELGGRPPEEVFADFTDTPVAAASIAQVHFATLKDGREVAVKILRPGIRRRMEKDIAFFRSMARLAEFLAPGLRRLKLTHAVEQFAAIADTELDLRLEAAAAGKLAENHRDDKGIHVPAIEWALTTERMLVQERISGIRIDDRDALIAAGHDIEAITRIAARCFFVQVFRDGFFHADMHPGNIFIREDGVLVPVDFGIMGSLSMPDRIFLARLLEAMLARDYDAVARLHMEAGMLAESSAESEAAFAAAIRAATEPIMDKPMGEISLGTVLGQIFGLARRFRVEIRPQFTLLQKTMVMAEGVGRQLNPDANMWPIARELANDWLRDRRDIPLHMKEIGEKIRAAAIALPEILDAMRDALERAGKPPPAPAKPERGLMGGLALILACTIGVGIGIMLAGITGAILLIYFAP